MHFVQLVTVVAQDWQLASQRRHLLPSFRRLEGQSVQLLIDPAHAAQSSAHAAHLLEIRISPVLQDVQIWGFVGSHDSHDEWQSKHRPLISTYLGIQLAQVVTASLQVTHSESQSLHVLSTSRRVVSQDRHSSGAFSHVRQGLTHGRHALVWVI
jgi:hypothetical protein